MEYVNPSSSMSMIHKRHQDRLNPLSVVTKLLNTDGKDTIKNEPYFVGKDVAGILGYQNGSRDVNRHVDEEDKGVTIRDSIGREQNLTVINICRHAKMAHLRCSVIFQKLG